MCENLFQNEKMILARSAAWLEMLHMNTEVSISIGRPHHGLLKSFELVGYRFNMFRTFLPSIVWVNQSIFYFARCFPFLHWP